MFKSHGCINSTIFPISNLFIYTFIFINSLITFVFLGHICSIFYTECLIISILFSLYFYMWCSQSDFQNILQSSFIFYLTQQLSRLKLFFFFFTFAKCIWFTKLYLETMLSTFWNLFSLWHLCAFVNIFFVEIFFAASQGLKKKWRFFGIKIFITTLLNYIPEYYILIEFCIFQLVQDERSSKNVWL